MYEGTFRIRGWDKLPPSEVIETIGEMLELQTSINLRVMRATHTPYPDLYVSGVKYVQDPLVCVVTNPNHGKRERACEEWEDIDDAYDRMTADCKSLAAIRMAQLRAAGIKARFAIERTEDRVRDITLFHITIVLPDGTEEDPSEHCGMRT